MVPRGDTGAVKVAVAIGGGRSSHILLGEMLRLVDRAIHTARALDQCEQQYIAQCTHRDTTASSSAGGNNDSETKQRSGGAAGVGGVGASPPSSSVGGETGPDRGWFAAVVDALAGGTEGLAGNSDAKVSAKGSVKGSAKGSTTAGGGKRATGRQTDRPDDDDRGRSGGRGWLNGRAALDLAVQFFVSLFHDVEDPGLTILIVEVLIALTAGLRKAKDVADLCFGGLTRVYPATNPEISPLAPASPLPALAAAQAVAAAAVCSSSGEPLRGAWEFEFKEGAAAAQAARAAALAAAQRRDGGDTKDDPSLGGAVGKWGGWGGWAKAGGLLATATVGTFGASYRHMPYLTVAMCELLPAHEVVDRLGHLTFALAAYVRVNAITGDNAAPGSAVAKLPVVPASSFFSSSSSSSSSASSSSGGSAATRKGGGASGGDTNQIAACVDHGTFFFICKLVLCGAMRVLDRARPRRNNGPPLSSSSSSSSSSSLLSSPPHRSLLLHGPYGHLNGVARVVRRIVDSVWIKAALSEFEGGPLVSVGQTAAMARTLGEVVLAMQVSTAHAVCS